MPNNDDKLKEARLADNPSGVWFEDRFGDPEDDPYTGDGPDDNNDEDDKDDGPNDDLNTNANNNTDLKARFRSFIKETAQELIAKFRRDPSTGVTVSSMPQGHPSTDAHKAYIAALAAYAEEQLGAKIEVHEWTSCDGCQITTFSVSADSLT